jgi:hypothetical protein
MQLLDVIFKNKSLGYVNESSNNFQEDNLQKESTARVDFPNFISLIYLSSFNLSWNLCDFAFLPSFSSILLY